MQKIKGKVLESFGNFKKGETYEFKEQNYKELLKKGRIEEVKATRKKAAPKKDK